ncbi:MAG: hypothetical protein A3F18_04925 [Legionellales bacterium RIFCSPHIGHO2_12_FULL_37_14]|nr:MAG: hypothetical protein A3F18_04925 [Legionellales bacterium RIFCSPHIGHO2_12_FULL_37_14]
MGNGKDDTKENTSELEVSGSESVRARIRNTIFECESTGQEAKAVDIIKEVFKKEPDLLHDPEITPEAVLLEFKKGMGDFQLNRNITKEKEEIFKQDIAMLMDHLINQEKHPKNDTRSTKPFNSKMRRNEVFVCESKGIAKAALEEMVRVLRRDPGIMDDKDFSPDDLLRVAEEDWGLTFKTPEEKEAFKRDIINLLDHLNNEEYDYKVLMVPCSTDNKKEQMFLLNVTNTLLYNNPRGLNGDPETLAAYVVGNMKVDYNTLPQEVKNEIKEIIGELRDKLNVNKESYELTSRRIYGGSEPPPPAAHTNRYNFHNAPPSGSKEEVQQYNKEGPEQKM